jgi:hypothetical protein
VSKLTDEIAKWEEGSHEHKALTAILEAFFGVSAPEGLSKNGLNWLAVPKDLSAIPSWALNIIDTDSVLQANTSVVHPILEAVGIRVIERPEPASYSNLIRF